MYKIINGIEKIDKEDLVLVTEDRRTRGYVKKIRMRQCVKDTGKYSFPHKMIFKSSLKMTSIIAGIKIKKI
ncbi:hypothetical protein E2C01_052788 [Portunus trituberculatus]|uniref:Uncharacterized protein n=1 Tax=Portunus trituberculatus TaxID=210409 RepID=A0A5B7GMF0_PORTR|nr:hypothetical protein [Portunus trituberculatus]